MKLFYARVSLVRMAAPAGGLGQRGGPGGGHGAPPENEHTHDSYGIPPPAARQ